MSQIYAYNADLGSAYARSYALIDEVPENRRLFFYSAEDDCTNFISQCVWASYGGWIAGNSDAAVSLNAKRILADVRQTKGIWFGSKSHIGSPKWCRVVDFYDYVTNQAKPRGPRASKIAEGAFWSVDPGIIRKGDVIQMVVSTYARERYGHAVYVTREGRAWEDVLICCHTYNRLDQPMTQFSQFPQIYERLRVLRFFPSAFDS